MDSPSDLEALSLEAVYHEFSGNPEEFARVEKKVLEIHPAYGRLYFTIAENLAMRRKYQEAVEYGNADSSSAWPLEPAPGAVT